LADVQLEHGFTKIANELLERLALTKLSPTQFKIIISIWRYTYGFHRKDHEMSLTFLSAATNAHKQQVKQELDKLIERKIIVVTKDSTYSKSRKITFNKNYDSWIDIQSAKTLTVSEITDTTVSEIAYSPVSEITYQERKSLKKDLKKKDTKEDELVKRILELLEKSEILGEKGITEFLRDDITDIIEKFNFEDPEQMIVEAVKDSARGNGKTWKYVYKKLVAWKKEGIKSLADLEKSQDVDAKKTAQYGKGYGKKPVRQEQLPDWFEESQPKQQPTPQVDADIEAKKQAIKDKLNQFRK
jgi:phage replication O-like protein O